LQQRSDRFGTLGSSSEPKALTCVHGHFFSPQLSCQVLRRQQRVQKCVATGTPTVATSATSPSFALPRDPLTKITNKPNFAAATELRKKLCKNAMPAHSAQGGQRDHPSVAMPAAQCSALPGAQPRVDPQNPGTLQIPASAAACQMALLADTHNRSAKKRNAWVELSAKLKQRILDAVGKAHLGELSGRMAGHAAVSTGQLLDHLVARCCKTKCNDIKANKKKLAADWSPAASLEQLWIRARECQGFAAIAGEPAPGGEMIRTLLDAIEPWESSPLAAVNGTSAPLLNTCWSTSRSTSSTIAMNAPAL
jgi:hypothetical protein